MIIKLPDLIMFEDVVQIVEKDFDHDEIIFDMSKTLYFHSAFIGFLMELKKSRSVKIIANRHAMNLFTLLKITNYFDIEEAT